ncbi:hypothetical protein AHAS_Ahas12G0070100 [Arachis hypogaea]
MLSLDLDGGIGLARLFFCRVGFINKDAIRFVVSFEIHDKQRNMQFLMVIGLKLFPLHIISLKWAPIASSDFLVITKHSLDKQI